MANLAIRGHATRGKEVIEILEMLGGTNSENCWGVFETRLYLINAFGDIEDRSLRDNSNYQVYTLEHFLEKFPYKVGDKVKVKETGKDVTIDGMSWRNGCEVIYDTCYNNDCVSFYSAEELQPYKEETMDKANKAVFDANAQCCDIMNHLIKEGTMEDIIKIDIPKGYEFAGVDEQQAVFEKVKPKCTYPKNYDECYDYLLAHTSFMETEKIRLSVIALHKVIRCLHTYWAIDGEPDFNDYDNRKYTIINVGGVLMQSDTYDNVRTLTFKSEEACDAFYENFKDLIEQCKELL